MNSISFGAVNSPLTQADITRLPNPKKAIASYYMTPDCYLGPKKKSGIGSFLGKLVLAAAAIVAVKHLGQNSFLKLSTLDKTKMTALDKFKDAIVKVGTAIENPIIKLYNKAKTYLAQKASK